MTTRTAGRIQDAHDQRVDADRWYQAELSAFRTLAALHPEEVRRLTQKFYDELR